MQTIAIIDNHIDKIRHLISDFQIFIQLLIIFDEQKPAATVINEIGQL